MNEIREAIRSYYDVYFGFNAIYEKLAKMHGITASSLFVLYMIKEYPDQCTQRLICEKLCFPKQTVNTILDLFEKKGYIFKKVSSQDKRNKNIFFTQAGKNYSESILSDMLYLEESAFSNMPLEESRAMLHGEHIFLEQLTNALNTLGSKILSEDGK
nr:MarR family winged helix-turn-helix transcriptional regulator [uncultured Clostridium sp.]